MSKLINPIDLDFLLYDVFDAQDLTALSYYQDHDRSTFDQVLRTAEHIAEHYFLPHHAKADQQEPQFSQGKVRTLEEVKHAWRHYSQSGLLNARHAYRDGGMQLPALIHSACNAFFMAANPATAAYPFLTSAAANVIHRFATDEQKSQYLPGLFNGRFAATMALTEPDAGSSLADLKTQARPQPDGSYFIKGQKMFISAGDHDLTDNIIHLVLARIQGATAGVKGLSLFIVPKHRMQPNGDLAEHNDVNLSGLLHKMGYRGTTSTLLNFGEQSRCQGWLLGEPHQGLRYMFQMMNEARIGVGLGAAMIGYRGYLESLNYARQRPQGRAPQQQDPQSPAINIIEHADVKRMLLAQKAYVEGSVALCLFAARLVDDSEHGHRTDSADLLELLTPIVKSYPSLYAGKANDLAIQVLGGSGYTRDYSVEQCYRDNRLNPIHEGTHGIQSLDLLGRKLWQGQGLLQLKQRIQHTLARAQQHEQLRPLGQALSKHVKTLTDTIALLGKTLQQGQLQSGLANSALFLDMMSRCVVAWLWLEMADKALHSQRCNDFIQGKLQAARYFIVWELPEIEHQATLLQSLDSTCLDMKNAWF